MQTNHAILSGQKLQLEPFTSQHHQELYTLAQDPSIWTYNGSKAFGEKFHSWFDHAMTTLQSGDALPFAVRRLTDQKLLGSTRIYNIDAQHKSIRIGYTWYIPEVWGTYVNPESKYLMLQHAFERLQIERVEFVTDIRNARSRAAIKKLGAKEEGILRRHMILADGTKRDSALYSIISDEWPDVKLQLENRLQKFL